MIALAAEQGISFVERPFTVAEAKGAREAFVTSATSFLTPVTQIDDVVIGNGKAGSLSVRLLDAYLAHAGSSGPSS